MRRRTGYCLLFAGIVFSGGILLYCASALRPFVYSPAFITEANVPWDAIPAVAGIQRDFRMGRKMKFSVPAYLKMLTTPSKHKVRDVLVRYPMEDAVLIQDQNAGMEVALVNLEDPPKRKWVQSVSGAGLNTSYFRGKVIGKQGGGGSAATPTGTP